MEAAAFFASLALAAPTVVAASPHADPSDRAGGGFLRVTFSPDGDGRNDRVVIRMAAPGRYVLHIHAVSTIGEFEVPGLTWDGGDHPTGSYVIQICTVDGGCAATKVLAGRA